MPGQRLLFGELREERVAQRVLLHLEQHGQWYLFDAGHGLPGVRETAQRILWDVE
jgi:hypothetical protein